MVCAIPQRDIPLVVFQLSGTILPEALSPIQLWGFWYANRFNTQPWSKIQCLYCIKRMWYFICENIFVRLVENIYLEIK